MHTKKTRGVQPLCELLERNMYQILTARGGRGRHVPCRSLVVLAHRRTIQAEAARAADSPRKGFNPPPAVVT